MGDNSKKTLENLAREAALQPQEKLQKLHARNNRLSISIPRETTYQEKRIPLSPLSVQLLVNNGHQVFVESGAGRNANFTDMEYSNAGAQIVYDHATAFEGDLILKVDPPTPVEIGYMKAGQIIFSALQLAHISDQCVREMMKKKITAVGYEFMRDEAGTLSIVRVMSEIAGRASVLIAAEYLNNTSDGKGELLGGIPGIKPTDIVIIGAGAVGEYAARAAIGLGAHVTVFDNSMYKLRRLETNLGQRINSSTILPDVLEKSLQRCDVAIGALRSPEGRTPCVVTERMVQNMRSKSLIIDVSIDQGGCFETSEVTNHENPVFVKHEVIHYCVPNIASRVSRTASYALSNVITPILIEIGDEGGFDDFIWSSNGFRKGVYIYKGNLTNKAIGERHGIASKEIDFLIAGRH
ncbi:MAG: alanine dehydrogenase [Flavobacteriales bacterium]|nr:alanine dehydrogenase [Flavobacteriales bacterium]